MWEKPEGMSSEEFSVFLSLIYGAYMKGAQDTLEAVKGEGNEKEE